MAPWQLSQQCCDFFPLTISPVKLPHSQEVATGKPPDAGVLSCDVGSELIHNSLSPRCRFNFSADELPNARIEFDQRRVDSRDGANFGRINQPEDFLKVASLAWC